jgi:polysaccharide biosynthesis/export protein
MKKSGYLCSLGLLAWLLAGCAGMRPAPRYPESDLTASLTVTNQLDPSLLLPPTDPFVLGPGDEVEIEVIGSLGTRATAAVGLDGKLYFSVIPGVDVMGLTLEQARARLEEGYSQYFRNHRVSMSLRAVASKHVWLVGRVNRPGVYPLANPTTLLEALTEAGGTAKAPNDGTVDLADLRHSFVMRQGHILPVNFTGLLLDGDMSQNIYLRPDDFVFIPSSISQEVYVLGAVLSPRTVPYADPMTLISAIAKASGPTDEAYLTHVAIVRGSLSQPQLFEVNYKDVIHGRAPNVILEPGDIVYVPLSPYRFITEYANMIVDTFARTWTANEGVITMIGTGNAVGVNVPVGPGIGVAPTH